MKDVASRYRSWLRHSARAGSARRVLIVLASSSFVLLAPSNAEPAFNRDPPPIVDYTIGGIRGTNGWYRGSRDGNYVVLRWTVRDPRALVTFTLGCEKEIISGPDPGSTRTCMAASDNGVTSVTTQPIKIDAEPPSRVVGSASRPPDRDGWYNHPVVVTWSGNDPTSGVGSCTSQRYEGPERPSVVLKGRCIDAAGNRSSISRFVLKYDQTPPKLAEVEVQSFRAPSAFVGSPRATRTSLLLARRGEDLPTSVVYRGARASFTDRTVKSGAKYDYTVKAIDRAGNFAAKTVSATARERCLRLCPAFGWTRPSRSSLCGNRCRRRVTTTSSFGSTTRRY